MMILIELLCPEQANLCGQATARRRLQSQHWWVERLVPLLLYFEPFAPDPARGDAPALQREPHAAA